MDVTLRVDEPCRSVILAALAALVAGCGGPRLPEGPTGAGAASQPRLLAPIVATQRGPRGGHLVFIDETGAAMGDLTASGVEPFRDNSAVFAPDGRWVAFASSRGRPIEETTLWVVDALGRGQPRPVGKSQGNELSPAWSPDGQWLVYAAQYGDGGSQLYRLRVGFEDDVPRAVGQPVRITEEPAHALHPSVSPDGRRIVFMSVDQRLESSLRLVDWDGGPSRALTEGPYDVTPAFSPDGARVAFAARADGRTELDLFVVDVDGGNRRPLVHERLADQTGPVWSRDGRYVFCTAVYRSTATGEAATSSVAYVELAAPAAVLRALHDPVAVEVRSGPALAPVDLDGATLARNPAYGEALLEWIRQFERRRE